ncbi:MAG: DUF4304 domain-containing protein [Inquilinaceae bacterium]
MIDKIQFKKTVGVPLKHAGYQKKRQAWYKIGTEGVTAVVDLQKSTFGPVYYMFMAFILHELAGLQLLPGNLCHIRMDVAHVFPDITKKIINISSLDEESLTPTDHAQALHSLIVDRVLPYMERHSSVEDLRETYKSGGFKSAAVLGIALPILKREPTLH